MQQQSPILPFVAVTGRVEGQDEDTLTVFQNTSEEQAEQAFRAQMIQSHCDNNDDAKPEDVVVYVNWIVATQSPITILRHAVA